MSEDQPHGAASHSRLDADPPNEEDSEGPNLKLFYGLIALALAAAIAIAAIIVLPFYRRR
jgi:hypothetical protein